VGRVERFVALISTRCVYFVYLCVAPYFCAFV